MVPKKSDILWYRRHLAEWYRQHHRHLPWHGELDAYRVLVSEVMLVQTTVATVLPRYPMFLEEFPTVQQLAAATESEVLKAWEGLGYYRRARQLHSAAKMIVSDFGGVVPRSVDELMLLPGVGRYMAGAVASFAYDVRAPILEANTRRVVARLIAFASPVIASNEVGLWHIADALVPESSPGEFNQAFMELGQRVCTSSAPRCAECCWLEKCAAHQSGTPEAFPPKSERAAPETGRELAVIVRHGGKILMRQRPKGTLWEEMWELPAWHVDGANPAGRDPVKSMTWRCGAAQKSANYAVTRYRMSVAIHVMQVDAKTKAAMGRQKGYCWVDHVEVAKRTLPSPVRKVIQGMKSIFE